MFEGFEEFEGFERFDFFCLRFVVLVIIVVGLFLASGSKLEAWSLWLAASTILSGLRP
jgi:hypothetical protein